MVEYYRSESNQDRICGNGCGSTCCYISAGTIWLTEDEILEIIEGFDDYLECYKPKIKEIFEKGFVGEWGRLLYLKNKKNCGGYEDCMKMKRPCIFLDKDIWSLSKDGACMIYPHRPQICRNTNEEFLVCRNLQKKKEC